MSKDYGIIGWPVEHSLSPAMHNAAFSALKIDACYDKYPVSPEELSKQVSAFRGSLSGWNTTVPHKQDIIPLLDVIDPVAEAAHSVNTVVNRDGVLYGYSTDGYGLQRAVEEAFSVELTGKHILFVGAGGAVQAAAVQFAQAGATSITVVNRTVSRAEDVISRVSLIAPNVSVKVYALNDVPRDMSDVDVIIQGTSVELKEGRELAFDFSGFKTSCVCMDMIYNRQTPFLEKASKRGMRVAGGEDMLLYQGAKAFELWTEQNAPVDVMRQALK